MKKILFTLILASFLCSLSLSLSAKLSPGGVNIYQGYITKIDKNNNYVKINNKVFYFKKSLLGELKALKKIKKKIKIKFKTVYDKKFIEKIIYKIDLKKTKNQGKF